MDNKTNSSETLSISTDETSAEKVIDVEGTLAELKRNIDIYEYEINYADYIIEEDEVRVREYNRELSEAEDLLKRQIKALSIRAIKAVLFFIFVVIPYIAICLAWSIITNFFRIIYEIVTLRPFGYKNFSTAAMLDLIDLTGEDLRSGAVYSHRARVQEMKNIGKYYDVLRKR